LVYGILFIVNFAHGEVFMAGAFTGFFVSEAMGMNLLSKLLAFAGAKGGFDYGGRRRNRYHDRG
jgi:branched-subunit amino acid ABC-type transport system permease component